MIVFLQVVTFVYFVTAQVSAASYRSRGDGTPSKRSESIAIIVIAKSVVPKHYRTITNENEISIDYLGSSIDRTGSEEARHDRGLEVTQGGPCEEFRSSCTRNCNADRYCQTVNNKQNCKSACLEICLKLLPCSELE